MIPLVAKILEVMDERGLIDMPLRVNGLEAKVVPVAPLAMAQNMEEVNAIIQYTQLMQAFGTDGALSIKTDMVVDYIGDKLGVPAAVRNTAAERAVLMETMQQQQQQAAMAQAMAMQAQAGAQPGLPAPEGMV
jgi:hypothetical protein